MMTTLAEPVLPAHLGETPEPADVGSGSPLPLGAHPTGAGVNIGSFSERRWAEWNGRYRDDVRRFWRGDDGMLGLFASRICGSADIYRGSGKGPENSINFVTCHDGFTLNDLVSYRQKHNEVNGEDSRDGTNANFSENFGREGETTDAIINALRRSQIKNFLLSLLISRGIPMLLFGDECRRTQDGNNNAYCWSRVEAHQDVGRFTRGMSALRRAHPILSAEHFYTDKEIEWRAPSGDVPNWLDPRAKALAWAIREGTQRAIYVMVNAGAEAIAFAVPDPAPDARWHVAVDTSQDSPGDLFSPGEEPLWEGSTTYSLRSRASGILLAF